MLSFLLLLIQFRLQNVLTLCSFVKTAINKTCKIYKLFFSQGFFSALIQRQMDIFFFFVMPTNGMAYKNTPSLQPSIIAFESLFAVQTFSDTPTPKIQVK